MPLRTHVNEVSPLVREVEFGDECYGFCDLSSDGFVGRIRERKHGRHKLRSQGGFVCFSQRLNILYPS